MGSTDFSYKRQSIGVVDLRIAKSENACSNYFRSTFQFHLVDFEYGFPIGDGRKGGGVDINFKILL